MKADQKFIEQLFKLFNEYSKEIEVLESEGWLKESAARTYLLHSNNFCRWVKGEFEPGAKNKERSNRARRQP